MKRFLVTIVTLIISATCLTGCCACTQVDRAHIKIGDEWKDVVVTEWTNYSNDQLQLTLQDGTILFIHSANCILYSGKLPIKK